MGCDCLALGSCSCLSSLAALCAQTSAAAAAAGAGDAGTAACASCRSRGNIYMISGAGGNVVASIGKDGVLLVDSGRAAMTDSAARDGPAPVAAGDGAGACPRRRASASCRAVRGGAARTLLPTTVRRRRRPSRSSASSTPASTADHIGGNAVLAAAGRTSRAEPAGAPVGAWIVAHENGDVAACRKRIVRRRRRRCRTRSTSAPR